MAAMLESHVVDDALTVGPVEHIEVHGLRIAYRAAGAGPPLVLLHGGLEDGRSWRHELEGLSDDFRVVAWDAPGCGRLSDPPPDFTLDDYADIVAGLIEALELGPSHIIGLSFGGGLALALYRRHETLIASLVLVFAYAGWAGSLPADEVEERRQRVERMARGSPEDWVDEVLATLFDDSTPAHVVDEMREIMLDTRPEGMLPLVHAFAQADLSDMLGDVSVPTLLLYGEKDQRVSMPVAEALAAAIPTSRLVLVPDAGHSVNAEAPEAFHTEVRSFLREQI